MKLVKTHQERGGLAQSKKPFYGEFRVRHGHLEARERVIPWSRMKDKLRGQESAEVTPTKAPFCGQGETPTPKESMILDVQVNTSRQTKLTIACQMPALPPLSSSWLKPWFKLDLTGDLSLGRLVELVYVPPVQKHSRWGQTNDWEWVGITGMACRKGWHKKESEKQRARERERNGIRGMYALGGYRHGAVSQC